MNSNPRDIQSLLEAAAQCYAQPAMMLHSPPLQDETSHSLLSLMSILGHHISDATKSMDKLHASLDAMEDEFALVLKDVMPRALASVPMQPTRRLSIKSSAPIIPPPQLQWATVSESCCSSSITASSVACSETSADDTTTEHLQMDRRQMSLSCDIEMQLLPPWPAAGSAPSPTGMAMETVSSHSYYGSEVAQNATPTPSKAKKTPKKARSTTARASSKGDDASKKRPNHSANTINTLKSWLKCHERHPVISLCLLLIHECLILDENTVSHRVGKGASLRSNGTGPPSVEQLVHQWCVSFD